MTSLLVPLPPLVSKVIRHLSSSSASTSGLFQFGCVDQHHLAATQLRAAFDTPDTAPPATLDSDAEAAVALLLFLADLPAPLLSTTLRPCFLDALAVPDAAERLVCVCDVVRLLPPAHFSLLRVLCAYLRDLARRAAPSDLDDALDAFAPLMLWQRDEDAVARLGAPLPLDVEDNESVVVIAVQSALQTAQLVLLGHLWTVREAATYIAAALQRCDVALRWRLELLDGTRLEPDELIGALDLAPMDTLYLETDDPLLEPDYVAPGRDILRLLVTECDAMLAVPSSARSSAGDSSQYGYVPRQGTATATSTSAVAATPTGAATDADFDAILDSVALMSFDDDDDNAALPTEVPTPSTPYQSFPARKPLQSAEAKRARKNLRATVTKSRMILKNENLLQDAALSRRSRGLAKRATPKHYLVAPPTSNALIDDAAPPRPRGPPPKKPAMAPARRKAPAAPVRAQYGVSRLANNAPAVAPRAQPTPSAQPSPAVVVPPRPGPSPQPTPSPPVVVPPRPAPRPAARPTARAVQDDRRATLGTPSSRPATAVVEEHRRATVAAKPTPPSTAKPLPAPPVRANRPAPTPPQRSSSSATQTIAYSNLPAEAARPAVTYSNLPAEAAPYDNLPAHTLRIQRANMLGGSLDDGGLEIEVFDDSLLGQLQQ